MTGGAQAAQRLVAARARIPLDTSRDDARRAARRELSKPLYHQHDPSLLQRVIRHALSWIGHLLDSASGVTPDGTEGLVLVVLIVLALLCALWWRLGPPLRSPASPAAGALFEEGPRSAADHRRAAEAHAAAGRWAEAVQERTRAVMRALEERALLDPRPGRTAAEAASEAARSLPSEAAALRTAASDFDAVTYGGRSGDREVYERVRALDLALQRTRPDHDGASTSAAAGSPPA